VVRIKSSSLAIVMLIILSACEVVTTAPNRLVGHWKAETAIKTEYYFSPIEPDTGKGTITEYDPRNGDVWIGTYTIHRSSNDGYMVTLDVNWPGEYMDGFIMFDIREDGKSSTMHRYIIKYIDSQTKHMQFPTKSNGEQEYNQFTGCPSGCTYHPPGCDIKGNISYSTEEKIYHVPGQEFYNETVINTEYGERWFCTEQEVINNGWRKSTQ